MDKYLNTEESNIYDEKLTLTGRQLFEFGSFLFSEGFNAAKNTVPYGFDSFGTIRRDNATFKQLVKLIEEIKKEYE